MSLFLVSFFCIAPCLVRNETFEGVHRLRHCTMRGNSSCAMVVSPCLVSDPLLLNWGAGPIRLRDHYLGPYSMVMPQRSGKKDAAETADLHQLLS